MKGRTILRRVLFRKKYLSWNNEKRVKMLERQFLMNWVASFVLLICIFVFAYYNFHTYFMGERYPEIIFDNLTYEERITLWQIIDETKPMYVLGNKEIIFTKDVESKQNFITKYINRNDRVYGLNSMGGVIIVFYDEDIEETKKILCHELLHTVMKRDEHAHAFIYDLEEYLPCFTNDGKTANPQGS